MSPGHPLPVAGSGSAGSAGPGPGMVRVGVHAPRGVSRCMHARCQIRLPSGRTTSTDRAALEFAATVLDDGAPAQKPIPP